METKESLWRNISSDRTCLFLPQTRFGCCLDGQSVAAGPNFEGCGGPDNEPVETCRDAPWGCCPDGVSEARGPNHAECPDLVRQAGEYPSSCFRNWRKTGVARNLGTWLWVSVG